MLWLRFQFLGRLLVSYSVVAIVVFLVGVSFLARCVIPLSPKMHSWGVCSMVSFSSPQMVAWCLFLDIELEYLSFGKFLRGVEFRYIAHESMRFCDTVSGVIEFFLLWAVA